VAKDEQLDVRTRDGRELFAVRRGRGAPTVVFEAGMCSSHHAWGAVFPAIAEITEAVAYDRSGLGRSPADPSPRSLARLVDDFNDLLDHLERSGSGPFVLVGHSWGGPIVRRAAGASPARIAGLVLVDQTDEGCRAYFTQANVRQTTWTVRLTPLLARLRITRLMVRRLAKRLPDEAAARMRAEDGTVAAAHTMCAELTDAIGDLQRLHDDPPAVPDVPITLISGAIPSTFEKKRREMLITAHRVRARSARQGRHVVAHQSGHMVPFTEPGVVIDEIVRIIATARERATGRGEVE
jgi:pimeloyl-ACP methyl ester carboxylesterase